MTKALGACLLALVFSLPSRAGDLAPFPKWSEPRAVTAGPHEHLLASYFYVPEKYRGTYWRCDLHARYRPDGKQIAFTSVHEGSRQVYVRDIHP